MLITGEVAEAHEALRKSDFDNFKEELADIVIRVADLAGGLDIDLEDEILKKMEKNTLRPYKHGKKF
jgi:NTP pyrophosphatase (non-canonical NTP hydrolase)